jgi:NAD(P)-dependent dehydrogenase (short-subunit alcohol dehydrogenase family)
VTDARQQPPAFALQAQLAGRVAVVTGGSGVLCGAMAVELARHGVKVAVVGRSLEKSDDVVRAIASSGGTARAFSCDVLDPAALARLHTEVGDAFGPADILINGAGGGHPKGNTDTEVLKASDLDDETVQTFFDITPEGFGHVLDLNLLGTWLPTQVFARGMIDRPGASVINISSMAAQVPITKVPAYSAGKAGVDSITKWLAVHLADVGIRVNAIAPGFFLTEQNRALLTQPDGSFTPRAEKVLSRTPMRRLGTPQDLLGTLLWLVDEQRSGFVTGITVPVDGGFMAYAGV